MNKLNKRIPGILPPPPKTEIDGKITDLTLKTIPELLELRDRQIKLLNNKSFISKLSDKGAKIQILYDKILSELKAKQEEEDACRMFENMKLNGIDKQSVQELEWTGTIKQSTDLDSDDDSDPEDVLKILTQNTFHEKKIKILEPEKLSITPEDLIKIDEIPHVRYIVNKTEHNTKAKVMRQFKPHKTTNTDVHDPEKEIQRGKNKCKKWEVTAATPPPTIHGPAKILSIEDSLKLQQEHNLRLKEVNALHAAERLASMAGVKMSQLPLDLSRFGSYRDTNSDDYESDAEGSDKEVHDEEPEKGGVIFTIMK